MRSDRNHRPDIGPKSSNSHLDPELAALSGKPGLALEIRMKSLGNPHVSFGVLIVLKNRDEGASHRKARAIQGMDESRLALRFGSVTDIRAPSLKIFAVGAGRNFAIGVLRGQPDLEVVSFCGTESHVPRAKKHHSVGELQELEDFLSVSDHRLQLVVRPLRFD